jgi:rubredoxin
MTYYCKSCKSTIETEFARRSCPICGETNFQEVPIYETVEEWEARTDKVYPDTAPVYQFDPSGDY